MSGKNMQDGPVPKILYIAGYSRSGSTMLDMILASHPKMMSTGELVYLQDDAATPGRICTCGQLYSACPVYGPWLAKTDTDPDMVRAIESRARLKDLRAGATPAVEADAYRRYARSLFASIADRADGTPRIVVDSSKSAKDAAGRPLALARLAGLDVRVLHLVRDPRAVMHSYIDTGSNWVAEGYRKPRLLESWRPIMGWTLANRIAAGLEADMGAERYMRLSYESLISHPVAALGRIGAFAGIDLSEQAAGILSGAPFQAIHNVGGNRARLEPMVIRLTPPKPVRLSPQREAALRLVARDLPRRLGYTGR